MCMFKHNDFLWSSLARAKGPSIYCWASHETGWGSNTEEGPLSWKDRTPSKKMYDNVKKKKELLPVYVAYI